LEGAGVAKSATPGTDRFTGPDAPKIVLDGVGFLEASDFIF
jgi:hypothetical protein